MNVEELYRDLWRDEGCVLHAYQDSEGYWTIGVGRMIDERLGGGINKDEAQLLLKTDVAKAETDLDRNIPWWRELTPDQQRGLCNMAVNLGWPRLSKFQKMLAALHRHDGQAAAVEALDSTWSKQVGQRAVRISKLFIG